MGRQIRLMEILDLRNRDGSLTGETKEREAVHRDGDIHGTSHVWIVRENNQGRCEVLLQKRSRHKDAYPGCYDISSAGHIPAGQDYMTSALREMEEELGICASEEDLHFIGWNFYCFEEVFYGKPFINREISKVYLYCRPLDIKELQLQEEEVESVRWMDLEECSLETGKKNPAFCVMEEELDMIRQHYKKYI